MAARATATDAPPAAPRASFAARRDHAAWAALALVLTGAAVFYYDHWPRVYFLSDGQWWLGLAAALLLLSAYIYTLRKRLGLGRFRPLRPWYVAHIWLSSAGFAISLLHAGLTWGGPIERLLLIAFGASFASGTLLGFFHDRFHRWMVALEDEHLLPEDLVDARAQRATEVVELLNANRPELRQAAEAHILKPLGAARVNLVCLRGRNAMADLERTLAGTLGPAMASFSSEERSVLTRVLAVDIQRKKLNVQYGLHRLRVGWVTSHTVLATLALALLILHVALVWYY